MLIADAIGYQLRILVPYELLVSTVPEAHIAYCHHSELDIRPPAEDTSHFSGRTPGTNRNCARSFLPAG